jgi:hypothetical protein
MDGKEKSKIQDYTTAAPQPESSMAVNRRWFKLAWDNQKCVKLEVREPIFCSSEHQRRPGIVAARIPLEASVSQKKKIL